MRKSNLSCNRGENGEQTDANSANVNGVDSENVGSLLYMHPSENSGASLVSIPFDGVEYRLWKSGVLRSLSVK